MIFFLFDEKGERIINNEKLKMKHILLTSFLTKFWIIHAALEIAIIVRKNVFGNYKNKNHIF